MRPHDLERKGFLLLLAAVTAAFLWIVFPLFGAILWGVTFAILFEGMHRTLITRCRLGPTWSALATTVLVLLVVVLPAVLTAGLIGQEGAAFVQKLRTGEIDLAAHYRRLVEALPGWTSALLERAGLSDLQALQEQFKKTAAEGSKPIATQLWVIGQSTMDFSVNLLVMLYLLFFLLRDGRSLMKQLRRAVPLELQVQQRLFANFAAVVRSTVKGNVVVAAIQGALGGLALAVLGIKGALLWAVVMALLSLLPAVGAALVWAPIAAYLLATGQVWQGVALALYGIFVIGLVDNFLRPVLVGRESRMPDYVVLVSTIGGMSLIGINGFVIGPVIAAMFIAAWDLAAAERDALKQLGDR